MVSQIGGFAVILGGSISDKQFLGATLVKNDAFRDGRSQKVDKRSVFWGVAAAEIVPGLHFSSPGGVTNGGWGLGFPYAETGRFSHPRHGWSPFVLSNASQDPEWEPRWAVVPMPAPGAQSLRGTAPRPVSRRLSRCPRRPCPAHTGLGHHGSVQPNSCNHEGCTQSGPAGALSSASA